MCGASGSSPAQVQEIRFDLYDVDRTDGPLHQQDYIGMYTTNIGHIVGSPDCKVTQPLIRPDKPGSDRGTITVRAEECADTKGSVKCHFRGTKLDKKDFFGKSDPFVEISRENADGSWSAVHKTEVVMKTLNPTWKPFSVPVRILCNGDYERRLRFTCYDWDSDGSHDLIGIFVTNLIALTSGGSGEFELINEKKKRKKKRYRNSGIVRCGSLGGRGAGPGRGRDGTCCRRVLTCGCAVRRSA